MTNRLLKLLTTTTAFVAVASAASASTVTVSQTAPITSTSASAIINVSGTSTNPVIVSVTSAPAVLVSGTVNYTLNVSDSATLRSTGASGTVSLGAAHGLTQGININNSGTIQSLGSGGAISLTIANADGNVPSVTLVNHGTISGSISTGNADSTITNSGTINGAINMGSANDTLNLNAGTVTGNVDIGAGTNTATISHSTLTGNYTSGGGTDTLTVSNTGLITGNVDLGAGANTFTLNSSTLAGNYTGGANADVIIMQNGDISGTITAAAGTDAVLISGTRVVTTKGAWTGVEGLGISGTTVNVSHTIGAAMTALGIANNGTLNISSSLSMAAASALTLTSGSVVIGAGKTLSVTDVVLTANVGNRLGIVVGSSSTAGQLLIGGGKMDATSYTIAIDAQSGYIASGTQYKIVSGTGAADALNGENLTVSSTGVYRFALTRANSNQDISLTIGRVATADVTEGTANDAIAAALDSLGANASNTLYTVQGLIGQQTTAAGVNDIVESLAPALDGAGAASIGAGIATGNQVSNRLASLRSKGVNTGSAMANNHMWVEGYGSHLEQDDRGGSAGYDATAGGMTIGLDTAELVDGFTTGASISYGKGSVDSNASSNAETDIDSYIATLYGSRVMDDGVFLNGQLGFGMSSYETERTVIGVGKAKGEFDGFQASAKVEAGKDFEVNDLTLTPLASLQYSYLDMDSYTETGAGGANLHVKPGSMGNLDAGLGGQAAYTMPLENGGSFKPSVHAKYIVRAGDDNFETTSNFTGGGSAFKTAGVKTDRTSVNLGAGLLLTTAGGVDFSVNYDADLRSSLTGHTGQLKARWAF